MFGIEVLTPPVEEPISVNDAKAHLRIVGGDEDPYISALITAAREYVETWCGLALMTQKLRSTRDYFPGWKQGYVIRVQRPPLQLIVAVEPEVPPLVPPHDYEDLGIAYTDSNGAAQTVDPDTYAVDLTSQPGRIALAYGEDWPDDVSEQLGAVRVTYVAGYASAALVPQKLKQAMLLLIGNWFENREAVVIGTIQSPLSFSVQALLGMSQIGALAGDFG